MALLSLAFGVYTFGLQWLIVVGVIRPIRVQVRACASVIPLAMLQLTRNLALEM